MLRAFSHRRRFSQFAIRDLLIAMGLCCVVLALWRRYTRHDRAVSAIHSLGGEVEWVTTGVIYKSYLSPEEQYAAAELSTEWRGGRAGVAWLVDLDRLRSLSVFRAPGIDEISALPIGRLVELKSLRLRGVSMSGPACDDLALLADLQDLDVVESQLDERAFQSIGCLGRLRYLSLRESRFEARHLARLNPGIERLDLQGTAIDDSMSTILSRLHELRTLILSDTNISDQGLMHLTRLPRLETIAAARTCVTADGAAKFQAAISPRDCWVYLGLPEGDAKQ